MVQEAEAAGNFISRALAYFGVGMLYVRKGDVHQAIPVLERGSVLCQRMNVPIYFPVIAAPWARPTGQYPPRRGDGR